MNYFTRLIFLLSFAVLVVSGCKKAGRPDANLSEPVLGTPELRIIDLGRGIYLKERGWDIPSSVPMALAKTEVGQFDDSKGRAVQTTYSSFRFTSKFVATPFEEIDALRGAAIDVSSATKVEVNGVVYKYEFVGIFAERDERTNKYSQVGPGTFYSYVDRDADGVFETLDSGSMGTTLSSWIDDLN